MPELIPIGVDHAGFELSSGAHQVASRVDHHDPRRGVLLCGTGLGMSYAANRHRGVRAAVGWSPEIARLAREHNDANVLILLGRFLSEGEGGGNSEDLAGNGSRRRPA
jgi:ribose 5-phosphate isomerase RpiB